MVPSCQSRSFKLLKTLVFETPHCTILIHSSSSCYREATCAFVPMLHLGSLLGRLDFLTGHRWRLANRTLPDALKAIFIHRVTICPGLHVTFNAKNRNILSKSGELVNQDVSI